ncbi:MAG: hypothetical protein AUG44_07145 [Actinobacteria bacterium 13_1_20CM_3_71_11]|nr:MAG: hypothetical protein AUG44_07145 [Actinobacteria bacterium 13_1_20CM_3_71_11]
MHRNTPRIFSGHSSRVYDFAARRLLRRFYRRLAEDIATAAPQGAAVLDVGTGPGVLLVELAGRRPDLSLTGVDLSPDMVTAANRNLGDRATVRVGSATELPFPDGAFDLVVSSISMHHWDHPEAAVPELARVLRAGGRLRIYDFPWAPFDAFTSTARDRALFTEQPPVRTAIRTGVPLFPRCFRLTAG